MGTREGAVRGLMGIGKEAIRKGVVEGGGAKVVGTECALAMEDQAQSSLVGAVMVSAQIPLQMQCLIKWTSFKL